MKETPFADQIVVKQRVCEQAPHFEWPVAKRVACVAWRFCRVGRTSGEAAKFAAKCARTSGKAARKIKLLPPQSTARVTYPLSLKCFSFSFYQHKISLKHSIMLPIGESSYQYALKLLLCVSISSTSGMPRATFSKISLWRSYPKYDINLFIKQDYKIEISGGIASYFF